MFGACLMGNAQLVADCVKAMRDVVSIPVTVKTRIGIDDQDSYEFLCDFINTVSGNGECEMFIIHARKAWLSGLSPKENREIPPLDYDRVYQLKRDFPHLTMSINGGIKSLEEAKIHLQHMDGVMVGVKLIKTQAFWRPLTVRFLRYHRRCRSGCRGARHVPVH
jgi:tRNA-dihydrouridine synthase A